MNEITIHVNGVRRTRADQAVAYAYPVQSPTASGFVLTVDCWAARAMPGVLAVLSCTSPPGLRSTEDATLALLATREIRYRGQLVAAEVADTLAHAREAAAAVRLTIDQHRHDVRLRTDDPGSCTPDTVPMEPHAVLAAWDAARRLTIYDSTQGQSADRDTIARVLGLPQDRVRVISPHVGGGLGPQGTTGPPAILAALAARAVGRPVKVALTCQQMFELTGYRSPTIQHIRLGAHAPAGSQIFGRE